MPSRSLALPLAASVLFLSSVAAAQGAAVAGEERAQLHFRTASAYYESGDYENALREFQSAYDHSHRPELLWNLYLVHERLGQWEQAIGALESFVQAGHPGFTREQVDTRLEHLRRRIERRQDGETDAQARAEEPIDDAAPAPAPVDTTPVLAIAGFSIAAVGLASFAIFGALALVEDQTLWDGCGAMCEGRTGALEAYTIVADVSAGVALIGATLGVIGLVIAPSAPSSSARREGVRVAVGLGSISIGGAL